jgi:hypothetical protein
MSALIERWKNSTRSLVLDLAAFTGTSLVVYSVYLRYCSDSTKYYKSSKRPTEVTWMGDEEYDTFSSICDAVLPSLTANECTRESLQELLNSFHSEITKGNSMITLDYLMANRPYLYAGALENGTNKQFAEALQNLVAKDEQKKLADILKVMNTTLGTFLLTGYPVAFKVISLFLFRFCFVYCLKFSFFKLETSNLGSRKSPPFPAR